MSDQASALGGVRTHDRSDAPRALKAGELAWIAVLPCALATIVGVAVLGPLVGHAFFEPTEELWPRESFFVFGHPQPTKQGRYLVALLGPLLLAAVVIAGARRRQPQLRTTTIRTLVLGSQLLVAGVVGTLLALQHFHSAAPKDWRIFTVPTFAVALAATAALVLAPRSPRLATVLARLQSATRRTSVVCLGVAVVATALWLLPAVVTERSISSGPFPDLPPWAMGDTNAIVNGRTPLVDFHPLYGYLWAYVAAVPMRLLGATITTFTIAMTSISGVALLAVYAALRRVAKPALALALYLPFLATSLFVINPDVAGWRQANSEIYSVWPMRYAGPLLLLWLTARHLDGVAPRRLWALFLVAGLVAINNLEFGLGALAGTLLAVGCNPTTWSAHAARRIAAGVVGGLLAALLLVASLTLVRAGALPHFGLLLEFPRVFGVNGLAAMPMPLIGFHLVLFVTFSAAIATAAVRVARGAPDVVLSGMLAWSGIFGLVAGSYFIGRSDTLKLVALFPAWALALVVLLVAAMRSLAARAWRRPTLAELMVLFAFGLLACSLAQLSPPWHELQRLQPEDAALIYEQPEAHQLLERTTKPGEHVAILIPMGHRIAYDVGVVNVSPYGFMDEIVTRSQMRTLLDAMRKEHARKLFLLTSHLSLEHRQMLRRAGLTQREEFLQYSWWAADDAVR